MARALHFNPITWLVRKGLGLLALTAGWMISPGGLMEVVAAPSRVEQVIVVFKTHFDIGYTDMATNVLQRYRTSMIDDALKVVDESRALPPDQQFAWTLPGWPMAQILGDWPGQDSRRQGRILQALQDGRFVVHALPFTLHTELLEPEELVRGLGYSSRVARGTGLSLPRDAKMTDVPSHSWILPTLLRHAGVDFLHLGCNAASRSPRVPRLFWWEGPDGSRLLTMYTAESYGTGLVPPEDWPYRAWLALIHTGDNHGPPTPAEVQALRAEAAAKLPGVKVRIGRLSDFSDAILADNAAIPVVRGDMPDTWIHGPMSDPQGASTARNTRAHIAMAEMLNTHLRTWLRVPSVEAAVKAGYEQSLLYGEHTWGGALWWGTRYDGGEDYAYGDAWRQQRAAGKFLRQEASWEEHSAYIRQASNLIHPVLRDQLGKLVQNVAVEGSRVVVYNPLPWRRGGLVTVTFAGRGDQVGALEPVGGGDPIALERDGDAVTFVARDIPASGYRTYRLRESASRRSGRLRQSDSLRVDAGANLLVSPHWSVALDSSTGAIRSMISRRDSREWAGSGGSDLLGQYVFEQFDRDRVTGFVRDYVKSDASWATNELGKPNLPPSSEVPYRASRPAPGDLRYHCTSDSVSAEWRAAPGHGVRHGTRMRITLYRDLPCIDLEIELKDKPADPWPESGWLAFPIRIDQPRFRLGRLGGVVDPTRDYVAGANHFMAAIHSGLTVTGADGRGIGFCPLDSPLVSLDVPGSWRYAPEFEPRRAAVYFNLYNNQWTTNFRLWNEGTWTSRVRLWEVCDEDLATGLVHPSIEARYPLQSAYATGPGGGLPPSKGGLTVSKPGTLVTSFGDNPDGEGLLLRLWEHAGEGGRCRVTLPRGLSATMAQPVDLRGCPIGEPLPIKQGQFTIAMSANAPASVVMTASQRARSRSVVASNHVLAERILKDRAMDNVLERAKSLLRTGFNAGSGYREVWIRDFATFIELSCEVVDRAEIRDNLLMFFRLQGDDGNIIDGFVPKSQANVGYRYVKKPSVPDYWGHKNTVETDQESSLVQAVRVYVERTGDRSLLEEVVEGRSVLERLELALEFLLRERFSRRHGLLWGATTVDWGDVQPEHEWGVELDASSHRAIDIYDNAMFLLAIRDFIILVGSDDSRVRRWQRFHDDVARNVRRHLWDKQREQFIPHVYLEGSPFPSTFDEREVYYHGGTAVAIQAGLLKRNEIAGALSRMRANVKAAGAGSIGLTVYPPYPEGTFKNPGMKPWSYQNGGDWDWFGGRMIQALVAHGLVQEAYDELQPMLTRVERHGGFHEWWDRQNRPRGSGTFRGAAGVLGKAILMLRGWAQEQVETLPQ